MAKSKGKGKAPANLEPFEAYSSADCLTVRFVYADPKHSNLFLVIKTFGAHPIEVVRLASLPVPDFKALTVKFWNGSYELTRASWKTNVRVYPPAQLFSAVLDCGIALLNQMGWEAAA